MAAVLHHRIVRWLLIGLGTFAAVSLWSTRAEAASPPPPPPPPVVIDLEKLLDPVVVALDQTATGLTGSLDQTAAGLQTTLEPALAPVQAGFDDLLRPLGNPDTPVPWPAMPGPWPGLPGPWPEVDPTPPNLFETLGTVPVVAGTSTTTGIALANGTGVPTVAPSGVGTVRPDADSASGLSFGWSASATKPDPQLARPDASDAGGPAALSSTPLPLTLPGSVPVVPNGPPTGTPSSPASGAGPSDLLVRMLVGILFGLAALLALAFAGRLRVGALLPPAQHISRLSFSPD